MQRGILSQVVEFVHFHGTSDVFAEFYGILYQTVIWGQIQHFGHVQVAVEN